ncbi:MAG: hypothetical protein BA861_09665 [Desulfobacterales bacterium S3730MH5]|nr:MAG: hypothetical protein BA861_09665 [Desulfobacterales bacterium S3730MH5]
MTIDPILAWFLAGLALVLLELVMPGVIFVFFGVGAWIVAAATYLKLTSSFESQLLLFSIASIVLLVFFRKWIKGMFHGHVSDVQDLSQDLDEFVGKNVVVLKDVIPDEMGGVVEFKGANWSAVSEEHIASGKVAIITELDGITLRIQKKHREA